jgi:hypothetical protein
MLTGIWPIVNGLIGLFHLTGLSSACRPMLKVSPAGGSGAQNEQIGTMIHPNGKHRLTLGWPSMEQFAAPPIRDKVRQATAWRSQKAKKLGEGIAFAQPRFFLWLRMRSR